MRAKLAKNDVCVAGFRFTEHFVQDFTMLPVLIFWHLFCPTCVTLVFVASICKKKQQHFYISMSHCRNLIQLIVYKLSFLWSKILYYDNFSLFSSLIKNTLSKSFLFSHKEYVLSGIEKRIFLYD